MKLKPERNDIFTGGTPPDEYREALATAGGLNPFGEPNFRLTLADKTRFYQGNPWEEYADGTKLRDRGGIYVDAEGNECRPPSAKPIRVVAEMRWVHRYPALKGWILQEWYPADHYGPPDEWFSYKVKDHPELGRLGPYPYEGDYELALPFGWKQAASEEVEQRDHRFQGRKGLPPIHVLRTAIQYAEYCREFWSQLKPEARIRMRENQQLEQQALQEKWVHDRNIAQIRDEMSPLWSNSLAAGRWRSALADKAGLKIGHVGN